MRLKINAGLYPHKGRFFIDIDGARHSGQSWAEIAKKVTDYRKRAGLPAGKPADEITAQVCARDPSVCNKAETGPVQTRRVGVGGTMKGRVLEWVNGMRRHKHETGQPLGKVSSAEAAKRAEICAGCPRDKDISKTCSTCAETLSAMRKELTGDSRVFDDRLGGCEALGIDLRLAVHLDEVRVHNPELPAHCWRKAQV